MKKAELIQLLLDNSEDVCSKAEANRTVELVFELMTQALEDQEDGEVRIAGFGNFKTKVRAARKARNPHTGDMIEVPERRVVTFKPSRTLKERVDA